MLMMTVLRMIQPIVMMKSDSVGLIELDTVIREETNVNSCILKKPVIFATIVLIRKHMWKIQTSRMIWLSAIMLISRVGPPKFQGLRRARLSRRAHQPG